MKTRLTSDFSLTMSNSRRQKSNSSKVLRSSNSEPRYFCTNTLLCRQNLNNLRQVKTQFTIHRLSLKELSYHVFQQKEKRIHTEKLGCEKQC